MNSRYLWLVMLIGVSAGYGLSVANSADKEPAMTERVYELRTYTTLPGRLDELHQRFTNHTLKLFEKHGMKNEMYWTPTDPEKAQNTLIYLVSHESKEAADKSWAAFRSDPEWLKARDASEADGKIVEKVESVFMKLTEFSPRP